MVGNNLFYEIYYIFLVHTYKIAIIRANLYNRFLKSLQL